MDFEIEEEDVSYEDFDWNKNAKNPTNTYFGSDQNDNDEYNYDFAVDNKNKKAISAFSPNPVVSKSIKPSAEIKTTSNINQSAMERAQSLMNKYSNKKMDEPVSNFRQSASHHKFTEDDLSMDSKEFSDMEISDSEDFGKKVMI